jgi:hypothetical protein
MLKFSFCLVRVDFVFARAVLEARANCSFLLVRDFAHTDTSENSVQNGQHEFGNLAMHEKRGKDVSSRNDAIARMGIRGDRIRKVGAARRA